MKLSPLYQKLLKLLRVRGMSGGLEITDTALRFSWSSGAGWQFVSVRLPQGVVQGGRLTDLAQFTVALEELRKQIKGVSRKNSSIDTIVSLGGMEIYLQVFSLPLLEGDQLKEAILLNMKMASPIDPEKSYTGWQIVGKDEKSLHLEILSAFIERGIVDAYIAPLKAAGFVIGAVEPTALSLSRVAKVMGAGFDAAAPTLLAITSDMGLHLLILRNGVLYFQYFISWAEIQGTNKEISWEVFSTVFSEHFRKVLNFYGSHWSGVITEVVLVAGDLQDGLTSLITTQFGLTAHPLQLTEKDSIAPEWFNALGAGLRALLPLRKDVDLSLLGVTAREESIRQQIIHFMKFWRIVFPTALVVLVVLAFGANKVIADNLKEIEAKALQVATSDQGKETMALQAKAIAFNGSVQALQGIAQLEKRVPVLEKIREFLNTYNASFTSLSVDMSGSVSMQGRIPSEEQLLKLTEAFRQSTGFVNANFPLQEIKTDENGVSFSVTFVIIASKAP